MEEERTLRTNYWTKKEISAQAKELKDLDEAKKKAIKKALAKMDPEIRKIVEKFTDLTRARQVVKAEDVGRIAGQMAAELMAAAMKKRKLTLDTDYWLKRFLKFVRSFRG